MSGLWLWLPVVGPIRASTVIAALVVFGVVTAVRRDPWRAAVAVLAWAGLFEIVYHAFGIVTLGWPAANMAWMTLALAGWVVLAAMLGIRPDWRLSLLFVALMGAWLVAGFQSNVAGQSAPINVGNEALNEGAKTALALAYLVGAMSRGGSDRQQTLAAGPELVLIFDGTCGVCTRMARWVSRHDRAGRVLVVANRTPGVLERYGVTREEADRAAWTVDKEGLRLQGAAALNRVMWELGGGWAALTFGYRLPPLAALEETGYRWLAMNRSRFHRFGVACEDAPNATESD